MDTKDKAILALLQHDAEMPLADIAARVHLSSTPCWRRIQKLRETGVIRKQVVLCDPNQLNLSVTVFVAVRTNQHIEVYRMSGEMDYLLRVVVPDISAYDKVYKRLIRIADLHDVSSSFAMEQLKYTTALPLDYVD